MSTIEILKELVSIPSWVEGKTNEVKIGNWIMDFLARNSKLKITKQPIGSSRVNILASSSNKIDVLVTGHMDTVQPVAGWTKNPVNPEIRDGKIYGLGTTDMKSGLAIMLYLSTLPNLAKNIAFLFYCDEEYDFLGMKKFVSEYQNRIKPKLIISLDGEGLQVANSCRGLIELKVKVRGKVGHAANPKSGINAITESFKVIGRLKNRLRNYKSKELGNSTLNVAYINGGGSEGNIIAEKCEYVVEIRVANKNLNAQLVRKFITKESENLGLKIESIKTRHDLGSWITPKDQLEKIIRLAPIKKLKSSKKSGYIDIQMLWQAFGKIPIFSLGPGEPGMSHKADEYIKISKVARAQKFYETMLNFKREINGTNLLVDLMVIKKDEDFGKKNLAQKERGRL